jgi:hypothetical protein
VCFAAALLIVAGASADRPAHPEPRVIVNVTALSGPHTAAEVQRSARFGWGRIVRCYKAIDKQAQGKVLTEVKVSGAGSVMTSREKSTTLKSRALAKCLVECLKGLKMPKAESASTATIEINVAPGDPP